MPDPSHGHPLIVSITTLPSRIAAMRPSLESLLSNRRRPDKLLIPLPPVSLRENSGYSLPDFLRSPDFCGGIVEVVPVERDWGPGTKLLGALGHLPADACLVIADDDVRYHADFLHGLGKAQAADHGASFSYHTYINDGLVIGQGCDGFSFWAPNLDGITSFAEKHVKDTPLLFHDDLWISFFLATRGIAIKQVPRSDGQPVYEVAHQINPLNQLGGELARGRIRREGLRRLLREAEMTAARRRELRAARWRDKLWDAPLRRLRRHLAKRVAAGSAATR